MKTSTRIDSFHSLEVEVIISSLVQWPTLQLSEKQMNTLDNEERIQEKLGYLTPK